MTQALPDKPSALIHLAVADLEKIEADPRYNINMNYWHLPKGSEGQNQCSVCFAGAVMAGTLGAALTSEVVPSDFDRQTELKLSALDDFRRGSKTALGDALAEFYLNSVVPNEWPEEYQPLVEAGLISDDPRDFSPSSYDFPEYEDDPIAFKAGARKVADVLAQHGF